MCRKRAFAWELRAAAWGPYPFCCSHNICSSCFVWLDLVKVSPALLKNLWWKENLSFKSWIYPTQIEIKDLRPHLPTFSMPQTETLESWILRHYKSRWHCKNGKLRLFKYSWKPTSPLSINPIITIIIFSSYAFLVNHLYNCSDFQIWCLQNYLENLVNKFLIPPNFLEKFAL